MKTKHFIFSSVPAGKFASLFESVCVPTKANRKQIKSGSAQTKSISVQTESNSKQTKTGRTFLDFKRILSGLKSALFNSERTPTKSSSVQTESISKQSGTERTLFSKISAAIAVRCAAAVSAFALLANDLSPPRAGN